MSRPATGQAPHIEALYQAYVTTGRTADARAWIEATQAETRIRWSRTVPERITAEQEATRQRFARVPTHRCRRCGIDATRPIWCDDCHGM